MSAVQPKVGRAADRLWEHQLRRENRVILEQLRDLEKQRESAENEIPRRAQEAEERLDASESRLNEVEAELRKCRESELEAKKERAVMIDFLKGTGLLPKEQFQTSSRQARAGTNPEASHERRLPDLPHTTGLTPTTWSMPADHVNASKSSNAHPFPIRPQRAKVIEPAETADEAPSGEREPLISRSNRPLAEKPVKQVANRRPSNRNRMLISDTALPSEVASPARTKGIRLTQGHQSIKGYYARSNKSFASLQILDAQTEYDFVHAFIHGLNDKKVRDKIIAEMIQIHPSRNKEDDSMEIMCGWGDIPDGFRQAGIDVFGDKEVSSKKRKGLLHPRGLVETGL